MRSIMIILIASLTPNIGAWRHDRDRETFRNLAKAPEFDAIGRLEVNGNTTSGGSGALIAPGWVLTAAHVVDRWSAGADYRFAWNGESARIESVYMHPSYGSTSDLDERIDLALVRLESPIEGVRPIRLASGMPAVGQRIAIVGHGFAQPANTLGANQTPPGEKYAGYNVLDSVSVHHFFFDIDSPDDPTLNLVGSAEPDSLEYGPLGGDSGGGIIALIDGVPTLIGVNGSVTFTIDHLSAHGWYGLLNRVNSVGPHRDWIDSVMREN